MRVRIVPRRLGRRARNPKREADATSVALEAQVAVRD